VGGGTVRLSESSELPAADKALRAEAAERRDAAPVGAAKPTGMDALLGSARAGDPAGAGGR